MGSESDAKLYIEERHLDGLSIRRADLWTLGVHMGLSVERIALLLKCHDELIARKVRRWSLPIALPSQPRTHQKLQAQRDESEPRSRREIRSRTALRQAKEYIQKQSLGERDPSQEELVYLYGTLGLSKTILDKLLRKRLGVLLHQAGIPKRTAAEQKLLSYIEQFFSQWTPEAAWVIGLLYTDGHVHGQTVSLSSVDLELLEKVRELVGSDLTIHKAKQSYDKHRFIWKLDIHHPKMIADLRGIGLSERKSLTMTFPEMPSIHIRHFIRGCWDGDGGFTWSKGPFAAHYTSGSRAFIERLAEELFRVGIGRRQLAKASASEGEALRLQYGTGPYPLKIYKRANANAYDLRFGSPENLKIFHEFLYAEVPLSLCLGRKRELLKRYMQSCQSQVVRRNSAAEKEGSA